MKSSHVAISCFLLCLSICSGKLFGKTENRPGKIHNPELAYRGNGYSRGDGKDTQQRIPNVRFSSNLPQRGDYILPLPDIRLANSERLLVRARRNDPYNSLSPTPPASVTAPVNQNTTSDETVNTTDGIFSTTSASADINITTTEDSIRDLQSPQNQSESTAHRMGTEPVSSSSTPRIVAQPSESEGPWLLTISLLGTEQNEIDGLQFKIQIQSRLRDLVQHAAHTYYNKLEDIATDTSWQSHSVRVIIDSITWLSKRQTLNQRIALVMYAVTTDWVLLRANMITPMLAMVTNEAMAGILGYPVVSVGTDWSGDGGDGKDSEDISLMSDKAQAQETEPQSLGTCCIVSIVLGVLLLLVTALLIGYFVFVSEKEKKAMKAALKAAPINVRLETEKDRLLRENGELKSQLKQLKIPGSRGAVADSFIGGRNRPVIKESQSHSILPTHTAVGKTASDSLGVLSTPAMPLAANGHNDGKPGSNSARRLSEPPPPSSQRRESVVLALGQDGKPMLKTPNSKAMGPPPGTGNPGQLISDNEKARAKRPFTDCGIAMPDGFKSGKPSKKKPVVGYPLVQEEQSQSENDAHEIEKPNFSSTKPSNIGTIRPEFLDREPRTSTRPPGNGPTASRPSSMQRLSLPKYNFQRTPPSPQGSQSDLPYERTQSILENYRGVILDLERQLREAKTPSRGKLHGPAERKRPMNLSYELAPADNYHQFHDALAVYRGDKTSRRNQGLPTTKSPLPSSREMPYRKKILDEVTPILGEMGYKIIKSDNNQSTADRKYKAALLSLYGTERDERYHTTDIVRMTQQEFSINTIARVHDMTVDETHNVIIDAYMDTGSIQPDRIMRDLHLDMRKVNDVMDIVSSGEQPKCEEIQEKTGLNKTKLKLALALLYRDDV